MFGFGRNGRRRLERKAPTDRRLSPRGRVLLSGKIVYGSGFTADCSIRDLSQTGACMILPKDQGSPPDFYLIVVRDGMAHRARTTWTRYPLAGVEFEASHDLARANSPQLAALKSLWSALTPRAAGRPVLN